MPAAIAGSSLQAALGTRLPCDTAVHLKYRVCALFHLAPRTNVTKTTSCWASHAAVKPGSHRSIR